MTQLAEPAGSTTTSLPTIGHWIGGAHRRRHVRPRGPGLRPGDGRARARRRLRLGRGGRTRPSPPPRRPSRPGARPRSRSAPRSCSGSGTSSRPHRTELAALLTAEHGKVPSDALGEIARGLENLEFAMRHPAACSRAASREQVSSGVDVYQIRQPLGVVAGITPFNFPAMVPMWMFATAIACGNTFILKPSEKDPSASLFLAELLAEAGVPDGVFNVVHGDKVAVDAILEHPDIAAVSFVGSTPIARYIYETGTKARQARPGARRRQEPHDRAARRRHRHGRRRRGLGRLRLGRRALHGDRDDRRRRRRRRSAGRGDQGAAAEDQGRAGQRPERPRWARSSRSSTATRSPRTSTRGAGAGRDGRADGREHPLYDESDGFFLGVSLHRPRDARRWTAYRDEIFGPVLTVMRVETYDGGASSSSTTTRTATARRSSPATAAPPASSSSRSNAGMVGINVPIPVPVAYYSFGGWKDSLFGDLHMYGPEGVQFYTRAKVVTSRWPDPGTSSRSTWASRAPAERPLGRRACRPGQFQDRRKWDRSPSRSQATPRTTSTSRSVTGR